MAEASPVSGTKSVRISRRILFSSAHFYRQDRFSNEENLAHFGRCFTPYGHGHNYVLEAFVEGPIDANTGLVMNLKDLDHVLRETVDPLDHHHLNFDVPEFRDLVPTTENIALYLWQRLLDRLKSWPNLKLVRIKLFETDDLWVEMSMSDALKSPPAKVEHLTRRVTLHAIHRLWNPKLTDAENKSFYGFCARRHGHDYKIEVTLTLPTDNATGFAFDPALFERILQEKLVTPLEGTDLNERFTDTSGEALALAFFSLLKNEFPNGALKSVVVQETPKNRFEALG